MNSSSIIGAARASIAVLMTAALTSGCYLMQAAGGQFSVMAKRRSIGDVIANPATKPAVREQLESVSRIREFASRELKLPDNGSYRRYADIGRPYVVWNVVAAPEFSLQPRQWCFPIAGCVAYRGYFKEQTAVAFAARQRARGDDVTTEGVAAYSTLGHFDDPILSSMLGWSDVQLAAIVFHELTHQLLYVPNDSAFNEALASVVEQDGVRRWLRAQGRLEDLAAFDLQESRYARVLELLRQARTELNEVYRSDVPTDLKRDRKAQIFERLRANYGELKAGWGGAAPLGAWFARGLNNARLASVATYQQCVPGLVRELDGAHGDLPRFYARARDLAKLPMGRRQKLLCGSGSQPVSGRAANGIRSGAHCLRRNPGRSRRCPASPGA
jgi:predicted aminopeptidase